MSILIPETEDIEKLQKRFSEALGDDYQVEMYTEVSSSFFFSKKNVFDLVIFRNNIPFVGIEYKGIASSIHIGLKPEWFYSKFQDVNLKYGIYYFGKENQFYLWTKGEYRFQVFDFASIINAIKQDVPVGERLCVDELAVEILECLPDSIDEVELHNNLDKLFVEGNIIFNDSTGDVEFKKNIEDSFFKALLPQMNVSKVCRYTSLNNLFLLLEGRHHCLCSLTCMNDIGETS